MTEDELTRWLSVYKTAWETQDPDLFVTLFTTDATYREQPFVEDVHGRDFHRMWSDLAKRQADNVIELDIIAVNGDRSVVNWQASTTRTTTGDRVEGNGIFILSFAPDGRCRQVREWQHWHPVGAPLEKGWPWHEGHPFPEG